MEDIFLDVTLGKGHTSVLKNYPPINPGNLAVQKWSCYFRVSFVADESNI